MVMVKQRHQVRSKKGTGKSTEPQRPGFTVGGRGSRRPYGQSATPGGSEGPGMPVTRGANTVLIWLSSRCKGDGKWGCRVGGSRENIDQDDRSRADLEVRIPHLTPTASSHLFLNLSRLQKKRETEGKVFL